MNDVNELNEQIKELDSKIIACKESQAALMNIPTLQEMGLKWKLSPTSKDEPLKFSLEIVGKGGWSNCGGIEFNESGSITYYSISGFSDTKPTPESVKETAEYYQKAAWVLGCGAVQLVLAQWENIKSTYMELQELLSDLYCDKYMLVQELTQINQAQLEKELNDALVVDSLWNTPYDEKNLWRIVKVTPKTVVFCKLVFSVKEDKLVDSWLEMTKKRAEIRSWGLKPVKE